MKLCKSNLNLRILTSILYSICFSFSLNAQSVASLLNDIKDRTYASVDQLEYLEKNILTHTKTSKADTLALLYYFAYRRFDATIEVRTKRAFIKKAIFYFKKSDSYNYRQINSFKSLATSFIDENIDSVLFYFDKALSLPQLDDISKGNHINALIDKAKFHVSINEYNARYQLIQKIFSKSYFEELSVYNKANSYYCLSMAQARLKDHIKDATTSLQKCISILDEQEELKAKELELYNVATYQYGDIYFQNGHYRKAINSFKQYIDNTNELIHDKHYSDNRILCYNAITQSFLKIDAIDSAEHYIDLALAYIQLENLDPTTKALAYQQKAEVSLLQNNLSEANEYIDLALQPIYAETQKNVSVLFQKEDKIKIHFDKAKIMAKLYQDDKNENHKHNSIHHFYIADSLSTQVLLQQFNFESSGLQWIENMNKELSIATDAAFIFDEPQLAWKYTEKRKSFLLLQLILQNQSPESIEINKKINSLTVREKYLQQSSGTDLNSKTKDSLLQKIKSEKQKLSEHPILRKSRISNLVQNYFPDNKDKRHYLQYISGTKNLYLISYINTKYEIFNLGLKQELYSDLRILYQQLSKNLPIDEQNKIQLLKRLFPGKILEASDQCTIIPDIQMPGIPFEIFSATHIFNYQLSYAIQNEVELLKYDTKEIVIDHPEYKWKEHSNYIKPLQYAKVEADYIVSLMPKSILQQDAKIPRNELWPKASIIHFTGHGYVHSNYHNSFLAVASDTSKIDSRLSFEDIQRLNLHADMVVLSACETAVGNVSRGEGVMSISRSLIEAGTKSVISTLWSVNEQSTAEILQHFYNYLLEGKRKDEALHLAKQTYLDHASVSMRHPQYWSGIIAIGDMSPIIKKDNWLKYFGFLLMFFLLIALFSRIKYTKAY